MSIPKPCKSFFELQADLAVEVTAADLASGKMLYLFVMHDCTIRASLVFVPGTAVFLGMMDSSQMKDKVFCSIIEPDTRPVAQYFYRDGSCEASDSNDPACICWHDVGTGPLSGAIPGQLATEEELKLIWRNKHQPKE